MNGHRCAPGAQVLDPECTWHENHYWCSWCEGFYGVPHDEAGPDSRAGCHSQPGPWLGGPPRTGDGCADRFCRIMVADGLAAAEEWRDGQVEKHADGSEMRAPSERLGPFADLYPSVLMSDRNWEAIIALLRRQGTARHTKLADMVDKDVQDCRRRAELRGEPRRRRR